jgi:hypothetical protein
MFDFIPYFTEILTVLLAAHAAAIAIVNLTETPKDDEYVAFAYRLIEWLAGVVTPKAKQ